MPDYTGFPGPLIPYLTSFSEAVEQLMRDFQAGRLTVAEWRDRFAELIATYVSAGYFSGSTQEDLVGDASIFLTGWLAAQLDYLNGFRDAIQTNLAAGGQWSDAWSARAQMYVPSIVAPYWFGETEGLPIPAYPVFGSSQCGQNDRCFLQIDWLDKASGDANVYWLLDPGAREHCQTCIERARQWDPLRIRDWKLVLPASAASGGTL